MRRLSGAWCLPLIAAALLAAAGAANSQTTIAGDSLHDPRLIDAVERTIAADQSGASLDQALEPVLALPQHGCYIPPAELGEPCRQEYGPYFHRPSLRAAALQHLIAAFFEPDVGGMRPSEALVRELLARQARRKSSAMFSAAGYARLGERELAEKAVKRSGLDRNARELWIGLQYDDTDMATRAALGSVKRAPAAGRPYLWNSVLEQVVAAGRTDLEIQIQSSRLTYYWGNEPGAIEGINRLLELGEEAHVREQLAKIVKTSDRVDAQPAAWVGVLGYLSLGDRETAEKVAAPWLTDDRDWPCDAHGLPMLAPFVGHAPYCNLGYHLREALDGSAHTGG
jgi:hypothetical protein